MQRALAFDRSPPLSVALRFFLNVPVFLMLAALGLAWVALTGGPHSRWNPVILAVAHFCTLGVLASAMLGAMMQILPVATHIGVLRPNITSPVVHGSLSLGTLSLALGFLIARPLFHTLAVILLATAFLVFLAATMLGLIRDRKRRSPGSKEILTAVRLALAALAITIALGLFMAGMRAGLWSAFSPSAVAWLQNLPDLHAVWGLAGWVGLLVVGISYQVIPIFQATEIYPRPLTDTLAPIVFLLLLALSVGADPAVGDTVSLLLRVVPAALLCLGYLIYASITAWLLLTRKRPAPEPTTWFWLVAMASLIFAALLGVAYPWARSDELPSQTWQMLLGTLLIIGFAVSAVNGMLYKIVPFLLWHNAQRKAPTALPFMPKVKQFITERHALQQFAAHLGAVVLLVAASQFQIMLLPGALALALSAGLLTRNFSRALRLYLTTCRRIAETTPAHKGPES